MPRALTRWLEIYEDEIGLFAGSCVLLFFVRSSGIVLNNYAETAFLKRFGVEYLPAVTAVNAVITFVVMGGLTGYLKRVRGDRLLGRTLVVSGVLVGAMRFAVPFDIYYLYPVLYVFRTQFDVLMAFLFWNLASDLFTTRQSKRIFPLITAGGILGGVAGSFGTPWLARTISADNLLLVFPLLAGAGALSAWRLGVRFPPAAFVELPEAAKGRKLFGDLARVGPLLKSSTLARVLLILTLMPNVIVPILNYQFSYAVNDAFPTEAGLLGFYSYFRGAQNVIALVLSLFVGRIYGRFGLPVALLFHPANYFITFGAFLLRFNIFSAVYAGLSVGVLRTTINNPATAALYGFLRPPDRAVLRPFLRGTVVRVGILMGSAIVFFGQGWMHPRYLSVIAFVFAAVWFGGGLFLKRRYSEILLNLLKGGLPGFHTLGSSEVGELFRGVDVGPVLSRRLRAARGDEAAWYAEVLRSLDDPGLDEAILERLPGADDATRMQLLPYLSGRAGERAMEVFQQIVDPDSPELMVALARTAKRVFADMPPDLERSVFEKAINPEVQACFVRWMRRDDPDRYARLIEQWLSSDDLSRRRAAVLAMGEEGDPSRVPDLVAVLDQETDPSILVLALRALGGVSPRGSSSEVESFLRHPEEAVRRAATEVLPVEGDREVRLLIRVMGDPSDRVRRAAIRRLEKTRYPVGPLLVEALGTHSRRVRDGLFQVARAMDLKDLEIYQFCRNQLQVAYRTLETAELLKGRVVGAPGNLLLEHLDQIRVQRVENVIRGLAAHDRTGRFDLVVRGVRSDNERDRADSVEALDSLLDPSLSRILMPMLENRSGADRLATGRRYLGLNAHGQGVRVAVARLVADDDWVTRLLALGAFASGDLDDLLSPLVNDPHPVVSAAARRRVSPAEEVDEVERQEVDEVGRQMDVSERIFELKKIDVFQHLEVGELAAIAAVCEEMRFGVDEAVLLDCDACQGLHLVVEGEVSVRQDRTEGPRGPFELIRAGPGESFGEVSLFGAMPAGIEVRTVVETRLLKLDRFEFEAIAREYPEIALGVGAVLSRRLVYTLDRLRALGVDPVKLASDGVGDGGGG